MPKLVKLPFASTHAVSGSMTGMYYCVYVRVPGSRYDQGTKALDCTAL